jgi:hypothetical protein
MNRMEHAERRARLEETILDYLVDYGPIPRPAPIFKPVLRDLRKRGTVTYRRNVGWSLSRQTRSWFNDRSNETMSGSGDSDGR